MTETWRNNDCDAMKAHYENATENYANASTICMSSMWL